MCCIFEVRFIYYFTLMYRIFQSGRPTTISQPAIRCVVPSLTRFLGARHSYCPTCAAAPDGRLDVTSCLAMVEIRCLASALKSRFVKAYLQRP